MSRFQIQLLTEFDENTKTPPEEFYAKSRAAESMARVIFGLVEYLRYTRNRQPVVKEDANAAFAAFREQSDKQLLSGRL